MISCRLRILLAERRMNRVQLSELSGLPLNTLRPLFNDTWKRVDRKTVDRICSALDITYKDLFEDLPEQPVLFNDGKK